MITLKVTQSKEVQSKINQFKGVRSERVAMLAAQYNLAGVHCNHAVMIDPIINQIDGYIIDLVSKSIPEKIELITTEIKGE